MNPGRHKAAAVGSFIFEQGKTAFVCEGSSMLPGLKSGETIAAEPLAGLPHPGRMYLYYDHGKLVLHRLVLIENKIAWFIGDAVTIFEKVPINAIIGQTLISENGAEVWFWRCFNYFSLWLYQRRWLWLSRIVSRGRIILYRIIYAKCGTHEKTVSKA